MYARNLLHFFKSPIQFASAKFTIFFALFLSILYGNVRLYYDYTNVKNEPIPEPDEKLEIVFDIDGYGTVIISILQEDCLFLLTMVQFSMDNNSYYSY